MHTLKVDSPSTLSTVAHQRKCHLSCSCLIHSGKMAGIFNDKTLSLMLKVGTSSRFFSRMPSCTVNPKKPCIIIMEIVVEWTVMGCLSAKKPQIPSYTSPVFPLSYFQKCSTCSLLPGWTVTDSKAVSVHRLAWTRSAKIRRGLHRLHWPST